MSKTLASARAIRSATLTLIAALAWIGLVQADAPLPAGPGGPRRVYTQNHLISVPVVVDGQAKAQLRGLELFVKGGAYTKWTQVAKGAPTVKSLNFRATQDGEFAFLIVSEDKNGQRRPAFGTQAQPGLIVVVDTQPPEPEVQVLQSTEDELFVKCEAQDQYAAPEQTRCEYQVQNGAWRLMRPVPGHAGYFRLPEQAATSGVLRVTVADLAGNTTTQEVTMGLPSSASTKGRNAVGPTISRAGSDYQPIIVDAPPPVEKPGVLQKPPEEAPRRVPQSLRPPERDAEPIIHQVAAVEPPVIQQYRTPAAEPAVEIKPQGAPRKIVNTLANSLEYQIEQAGPSGIGRVEVWMTRDQGQTWSRLAQDPDARSPVQVELPGEGVFGLSVAVSNGRGFGGDPPARGATPDYWLEVDTTPPEAQVVSVQPSTQDQSGMFVISWRAADRNLVAKPVDLFYAPSKDGPWLPIGAGLGNDGHCRWQVPPDAGRLCFIRLLVRDQAGNVRICDTPDPVPLDDLSRPRAKVLGVTTVSPTK